MHIISCPNIDLIEPFPAHEAKRVFGWLHCYKNIVESDLSPKTPEEFAEYLSALLPFTRSFGIIDKNNELRMKHEAPLVGMIVFEPSTLYNCYIHIASPRRAWGHGFMDQGISAALSEIFSTEPQLLRVSAYVLENNAPVKGLARRLGFRFEGNMADLVLQDGAPKNVLHFGMTRRMWVAPLQATPAEPAADESVAA